MPLTAGIPAFTLSLFLQNIILIAGREISNVMGIRDSLQALASKVERLQASLSKASRSILESQAAALWLNKLEAVVADGTNLLDRFQCDILRGKLQDSNCLSASFFRRKMLSKFGKIQSMVDEVYHEIAQMDLQLENNLKAGSKIEPMNPTIPLLDESDVVGRGKDLENILPMILDSSYEEKTSFISIVGMPGIGKTTLAQLVYNDHRVCTLFDFRIWVPVGADFNVDRILKEMLEHLTMKNVDVSSTGAVVEILSQSLHGKRGLLVLDDVWNENPEAWNFLRNCLHEMGGSTGSKILVTTRSHRVTSALRSSHTYHLQLLRFTESSQIFEVVAFPGGWMTKTQDLYDNVNSILRRCGGLPLAIKLIGGLVAIQTKNNLGYFDTDKIKLLNLIFPDELYTSLKLSYDSFPSLSLKQCFAYCSVFPEHYVLEKETLVRLWMAQGFITLPDKQYQEMEDLGDEYINLLLQSSMLQEVEKDVLDNIKSCKMHNLVHEFALHLPENYGFITEEGEADADIVSTVEHLYLICQSRKSQMFWGNSLPMLRTLCLEEGFLQPHLASIKFVRVLILDNAEAKELPSSIGRLKHLRYLDVSRTRIERLPNSITKLFYLQTLRLYSLTEMPLHFCKLVNLRHLQIENMFYGNRNCLLTGIGELANLRTIPSFLVSQETGCGILELKPLCFLRGELKIFGLENVKDGAEASAVDLSSKSQIRTLELHWGSPLNRERGYKDEDILEGLRPHSNLQRLAIINYDGTRFPSWIAGESLLLSNLVTIKLQNCNRCDEIPALGHFPSLKVVQINTMKSVKYLGEDFYGFKYLTDTSSKFSALKELTLTGMSSLAKWSKPSSGAVFPSLEMLTIKGCPQLISLSDLFSRTPLRRLSIVNCGSLQRLPDFCSIVSLEYLEIMRCNYLEYIPSVENLQALRELSIVDCNQLRSLPYGLGSCESLRDLYILSCPFVRIRADLYRTRSLRKLEIGCFSNDFEHFPWSSSYRAPYFISLTSLKLCGWPNLSFLPEQVREIPQLTHLHVCLFDGLEALPDWLVKIKSLATLVLEDCWNLAFLPSAKLTNLSKLTMLGCPLLEHKCASKTDAEWHKIKHIPHVFIGRREWES